MSRMKKFLLAGVVLLIVAFAAHLLTFDHYAGVWGFSAGTDTHYCSVELLPHPEFSCETAN